MREPYKEAALPPDWLARDLTEAPSDVALGTPFGAIPSFGRLDADDAARLRAKMAARYQEWTGRDLATDLALEQQERRDG